MSIRASRAAEAHHLARFYHAARRYAHRDGLLGILSQTLSGFHVEQDRTTWRGVRQKTVSFEGRAMGRSTKRLPAVHTRFDAVTRRPIFETSQGLRPPGPYERSPDVLVSVPERRCSVEASDAAKYALQANTGK